MDSRDTANFAPSMLCPGASVSNVVVMACSSHRPNRPAAARTDDLAVLVEEDVVVNDEQPLFLDEFVQRPSLQRDRVVRAGGNVVAPGLARVHGARASHPII